jgi:hypothetical protein
LHRAILGAGPATGAFFFDDIPGLSDKGHMKVPRLASNTFYFGIGKDLDVGMPADLDQFR